jgi:D-alanyl-lipoteichoic acid acyltransferase DltB (MBOAT superfamily)
MITLVVALIVAYKLLPQSASGWNSQSASGINWFVPVGLSFLSFSGISYLIDIKRDKIRAQRTLLPFVSFFLYFPKLVMGPIERPATGIAYFQKSYTPDYFRITNGLKLIAWGFFKKVVVADRLALITGTVFGSPGEYSGIALFIASLAFMFQVYADFSGYTDIAIGISGMLGIDLTQNFNRPYFASTGIRDFWRRWHITLSNWLRDYLFLPLAYWFSGKMKRERYFGMKSERWIYIFATMITFAVCGLWHGIGWTFLFWGILFGFYLSVEMLMEPWRKAFVRKLKIRKKTFYYSLAFSLPAFVLVFVAWIFFRASSLQDAFGILASFARIPAEMRATNSSPGALAGLLSGLGVSRTDLMINAILVIFLFAVERFQKDQPLPEFLNRMPKLPRWSFYYALLLIIVLLGAYNSNQDFIYARF